MKCIRAIRDEIAETDSTPNKESFRVVVIFWNPWAISVTSPSVKALANPTEYDCCFLKGQNPINDADRQERWHVLTEVVVPVQQGL